MHNVNRRFGVRPGLVEAPSYSLSETHPNERGVGRTFAGRLPLPWMGTSSHAQVAAIPVSGRIAGDARVSGRIGILRSAARTRPDRLRLSTSGHAARLRRDSRTG